MTETYRIPGYEGSIGPGPGYGRLHVYARDTTSGAGNCVCGQALGQWLHVQAAPGVPIPPNLRPSYPMPFACRVCGMVSYNPNDKRESYCGYCHDWTGDLYPNAHALAMEQASIRLTPESFDALAADLELPARPSKLRDLLEAQPGSFLRAVTDRAVTAARRLMVANRQAGERTTRDVIELATGGQTIAGGWGLDWRQGTWAHRARLITDRTDDSSLLVSACGLTAPWERPTPAVKPRTSTPSWPDTDECGFCLLADETIPKNAEGSPL